MTPTSPAVSWLRMPSRRPSRTSRTVPGTGLVRAALCVFVCQATSLLPRRERRRFRRPDSTVTPSALADAESLDTLPLRLDDRTSAHLVGHIDGLAVWRDVEDFRILPLWNLRTTACVARSRSRCVASGLPAEFRFVPLGPAIGIRKAPQDFLAVSREADAARRLPTAIRSTTCPGSGSITTHVAARFVGDI